MDAIKSGVHKHFHIATHPEWYAETEGAFAQGLIDFILAGNYDRYQSVRENVRDIEEIIKKEDIVNEMQDATAYLH